MSDWEVVDDSGSGGGWEVLPAEAPVTTAAPEKPASRFGITDALMSGIPLADEAGAAGRTVSKVIGKLYDAPGSEGSIGDIYDRELGAQRGEQQQYFDENPVTANAASIVGSTAFPMGKMKTLKQAAASGAALGGVYGFASGEDGFLNRVKNAAENALTGGVLSPVLKFTGDKIVDIGEGATKVAQNTWNKIFGISASDIRKSIEKGVRTNGAEAPILGSFKRLVDSGDIVPGDALTNRVNIETQLKTIGKEIPTLFSAADDLQTTALRPVYSNTEKYINNKLSDVEKTKAFEYLNSIKDAQKRRAFLSEWQQEQSNLAAEGAKSLGMTGSEALQANIKKFAALDIKQAIDKELASPLYKNQLGEDLLGQIRSVRKQLADRHTVLPSLVASEARGSQEGIKELILNFTRTTGGFGVPAALGAAHSYHEGEDPLIGAAKGFAAGALLRSNSGQLLSSWGLRNLIAPVFKALGTTAKLPTLVPTVQSNFDATDNEISRGQGLFGVR